MKCSRLQPNLANLWLPDRFIFNMLVIFKIEFILIANESFLKKNSKHALNTTENPCLSIDLELALVD